MAQGQEVRLPPAQEDGLDVSSLRSDRKWEQRRAFDKRSPPGAEKEKADPLAHGQCLSGFQTINKATAMDK